MENIVEQIHSLLFSNLILSTPILSGNMKNHIKMGQMTPDYSEIVIDAPFYDMKKWEKDKIIVHTGQVIRGRTAYAEWVNRLGGFATHNESEGWVNRAILEAVTIVANQIGAQVIYDL